MDPTILNNTCGCVVVRKSFDKSIFHLALGTIVCHFPHFFSMAKVSLVLFSSLALELFAWRFVSDVLIIVDPIKQAAVHCIFSALSAEKKITYHTWFLHEISYNINKSFSTVQTPNEPHPFIVYWKKMNFKIQLLKVPSQINLPFKNVNMFFETNFAI